MELIDQVSISTLSKKDLLLIIKSLEYTYEGTKLNDFVELRNSIVEELCFLTNTKEDEFISYLESNNN